LNRSIEVELAIKWILSYSFVLSVIKQNLIALFCQ